MDSTFPQPQPLAFVVIPALRFHFRFLALGLFAVVPLSAQEKSGNGDPLAILEAHCVQCHGGEKTKGGLDLTTRDDLLLGGASGTVVVPGKPEESLLFRMVMHQDDEIGMPYKEDKLGDGDLQKLTEWIRAGVPYARAVDKTPPATAAKAEFTIKDVDRAHWAFQPVKRATPPAVKTKGWARNSIDNFILADLEANGLKPAPPASREVLIRRVTFDLIGLPPTPAEVDAFVKDRSPKAYDNLVERLLASPHYGERWGRHWLDLVRYAESDGYEHDASRPNAWRYRDYVVRAFNSDKPYDRFMREQIAGDELYPDDPDALTATAFALLGPDMVDSSDVIQRRRNTITDMADTTALAFLGLTMGCARCHDHKFEPISQRDYYSLQAFFDSAEFRTDLPAATRKEKAAYEAALAKYTADTKDIVAEIAALEAPARKMVFNRKFARISVEAQTAHSTPKEKRTLEQENLVQGTAGLIAVADRELPAAMPRDARERHAALQAELAKFSKPTLPQTLALQDGPPAKSYVLFHGDYNQPREEVQPAFPEILVGPDKSRTVPATAIGSYRAPLANWLASPDHPLTSRVMVNRIWQHHFGKALVGSPSNFGTHGQKPTHPELLDWLASEFVARGWSMKEMHRLMLHSAAYQQASSADAATVTRDPDNRHYSRMNRLRLEGEAIRDSLLAISGELNPELGGPSVFPPIPKEIFAGAAGWTPGKDPHEYSRRSLYIFGRRNLRFPFLEVFDAPDNNLSCPVRERSTTAPQSLTLLNADEVLRAADLTAQRIDQAARTAGDRVTLAYQLILGRAPTGTERGLSQQFLSHSPTHELCRALFNLNAFVYVE